MERYLFQNAEIIFPTGIRPGQVLTENGKIKQVFEPSKQVDQGGDVRVIDAQGKYLSPGFLDIHTHGGGGADFMDGDPESIRTACRTHMAHGTTAIIPTTMTSTKESLLNCLTLFDKVDFREKGMPEILGLHLEGPYFSYGQRGAQSPENLRDPAPEEYEEAWETSSKICRWSFAVELEGADAFLQFLQEKGIVASLAHSDADCGQVKRAYDKGLKALTHFYSGMSGVTRRNAYRVAGAIEAGYLLDDLFVEVIADGCHLPGDLLQLIYQVKGANRICLVTDSMRGAGMPEGEYILGGKEGGIRTIVEEGVAKLPDRSAFAGSVATMDRLVRTMHELTTAPLHEIIQMASLTPAALMGIDGRKGSVSPGKDADLLLLDKNLEVDLVMVRGEIVL